MIQLWLFDLDPAPADQAGEPDSPTISYDAALNVYDLLWVFGVRWISFADYWAKFRRERTRETAKRSWNRLRKTLRDFDVAHEVGEDLNTGGERIRLVVSGTPPPGFTGYPAVDAVLRPIETQQTEDV